MKKLLLIAALLLAGGTLSACGQKGGLYLPDASASNALIAADQHKA